MFFHGGSLRHPVLTPVPGAELAEIPSVVSPFQEPRVMSLLTLRFTSICASGVPRHIVYPLKSAIASSTKKPRIAVKWTFVALAFPTAGDLGIMFISVALGLSIFCPTNIPWRRPLMGAALGAFKYPIRRWNGLAGLGIVGTAHFVLYIASLSSLSLLSFPRLRLKHVVG